MKQVLINQDKSKVGYGPFFLLLLIIGLSYIFPVVSANAADSATTLARKGNAALSRNDNINAIQYYSEALVAGSLPIYTTASILNDRGLAYSRIKRYELALKDLNSAIDSFPEYAKAYNNRGLLLHQLGLFKEAIKDFNRAIALKPDMGAPFHNRGNSLLKAGAEASAFKDYGTATALLSDKSSPHLARGQIHWSHHRHYAALRELNLSLARKSSADALYERGQIYHSLGNRARAIQDISKASSMDRANNNYRMDLASIYFENRQLPSAKKLLTKILVDEPLNIKAMIMRGRINGKIRKYNAALNDLDQAISLGKNAEAYAERALVQALLRHTDQASEDMNNAILNSPKTAHNWKVLGDAARHSDLLVEAERYYLEALKINKNYDGALDGLKLLGFGLDDDEVVEDINSINVENVASISTDVDGWSITDDVVGRYVAKNPIYKKYNIKLDLYGPKKPKILEWTVLTGNYRGFALLRYDAGNADAKTPIEHVVILNLRKQKIITIEPYRWGTKIAKWTWEENGVTIKDPDGIESKIKLRTPRKKAPARIARQRENHWTDSAFWISDPRKTNRKKKRRVKYRKKKKKKKKIFGIFGF